MNNAATLEKSVKVQDLTHKMESAQQTLGKVKPNLFNLIIFSDEEWRTAYFKTLVETILINVPCRIFFVQISPDNHYEVLEESFQKDNTTTPCDFFTIKGNPESLTRIPSVIMPLLLSDRPLYLLWGENPFSENVLLPQFQQYADRIIVVSDCCKGIQAFANDLITYSEKINSEMIDINWAMLGGWRDIIAELFDNECQLKALEFAKHVEITYNSRADNLKFPYIRATFMQGWIASQLQWTFKKYEKVSGIHIIHYKSNQQEDLIVELKPQYQEELFPGAILDIIIKSCVNGEIIEIRRKETLSKVNILRSDELKCDIPFTVPLPQVRRPINFIREIFFQKPSKHYHAMLHKVAEVPWI